ncbi:MAG: 16S rRNA (guanine(966)-N(2))-methyltransferase RsmD [Alphaproteobacteria bacterium]|nr:MAG: 16S rRNA (guanine(966)-N(2))-methyltransferase RsmD [Alphaproteobacteria bacterium]
MRIIAGKFRGRILSTPQDQETRPTADRVRENLFNILDSLIEKSLLPPWEALSVLDGFCGTGALGLEALSRGVAQASFIEKSRNAAAICKKNITACKLPPERAVLLVQDILKLPALKDSAPKADLLFLDPPYGQNLGIPALLHLRQKGYLSAQHICVLETDKKHPEDIPAEYQEKDTRLYGRVRLTILLPVEN